MARALTTILTLLLVISALRLAIIALVVAGLMFRTQVTVSLLLIGGVFALLATFPLASIALLVLAALTAIVWVAKRETGERAHTSRPAVLRRHLDDPDQE